MNYDIEEVNQLCFWMIERIAANRETAIDEGNGCDWNWVAGEVWHYYPGIVNEFLINDAIDLIMEAAKCSE